MATATVPVRPGALLRGIGWNGYEQLLDLIGDGHVRVTYDQGDAEIMSPSPSHDRYARLIFSVVVAAAAAASIPVRAYGSTTWRRRAADRGLEADECFYLGANARQLRSVDLDLETCPPPDLAIEIEVTRTVISRLPVYAGLGVPEIWRFDGAALVVLLLDDTGTYQESSRSRAFPWLVLGDASAWIRAEASASDFIAWDHDMRNWIRESYDRRPAD